MLVTATCWRECTRYFCFAAPSNFAFTWATALTIRINSCPVKCSRNVDESGHFVDGRQTGMYGPPLCRKRKMKVDRMVFANVFGLLSEHKLLALMECAARSSYLVRQPRRLFRFTGFESAGFDRCVISWFASRPGRNHRLRSSRWSVDVGIANAISKPGFSQASSADQLCCGCTDHDRRSIGFILSEYSPGHTRQLIG